MPFVSRVLRRIAPGALLTAIAAVSALSPTGPSSAAADHGPDTVPVEVDLVGEAIDGLSAFVAAGFDTEQAEVGECPILSYDDLAGLVGSPAQPDDYRRFGAFTTRTERESGDLMTLECQSSIIRSEGNERIDSAILRILLYPETPSLEELLAKSAPDGEVRRLGGLDTVGYCHDSSTSGRECVQAWQSGRLIVTLSRTSHEADVEFDATTTGATLMALVPTVLYDLAVLDDEL